MANIKPFDTDAAIKYSFQWALSRNPNYYDFTNLGGDCSNFISQCLYAGARVMNPTPIYGWYYYNINNRSPSWTSVNYLYRFLTTNKTLGPFATPIPLESIKPGDLIQLQNNSGVFYHTLLVVEVRGEPIPEHILINAHDIDSMRRPLATYQYSNYRCLRINGVYI